MKQYEDKQLQHSARYEKNSPMCNLLKGICLWEKF